jgi:hypothetical protein
VRASGITEPLSDIVITCQGGTPGAITTANLQIFANVQITSRLLNPSLTPLPASEVLLLVDEPPAGTATLCTASQMQSMTCPPGANAFQAVQVYPNSVAWYGFPFVVPGPGQRTLRIVNLRGNASFLPPPGPFNPVPVQAFISLLGPLSMPLMNPQLVVGFTQEALSWSLRKPTDPETELEPGALAYQQCVAHNGALSLNPASPSAPDGAAFVLRVSERFEDAFKKWTTNLVSAPPSTEVRTLGWLSQDTPGILYPSENRFFSANFSGLPDNMGSAGYASSATRFTVRITGPAGLQIHAPAFELGKDSTNSRVRLVAAEPATPASDLSPYTPLGPASAALGTYYSSDMTYVYEITTKGNTQPWALDHIDLLFYAAHPGQPYVAVGQRNISVYLSPVSTATQATRFDWIPRFAASADVRPLATVTACPPQPKLTGSFGTRSGPAGARIWPVRLTNIGAGPAVNAQVTSVTISQTSGASCSPAPVKLTPEPIAYGTIAPGAGVIRNLTINFAGCPALARFTATIHFAADGGYSGSTTYYNLYR